MMPTVLPWYVTPEYIAGLQLRSGQGTGEVGDRCAIQERRAWSGLNPASDECAPDDCPIITRAVIRLNDRIKDPALRSRLLGPLLVKMVGSRAPWKVMEKRAYLAADAAVRVFAPAALEAAKVPEWPDKLRGLPAICDRASAEAVRAAVATAYDAAYDAATTAADAATTAADATTTAAAAAAATTTAAAAAAATTAAAAAAVATDAAYAVAAAAAAAAGDGVAAAAVATDAAVAAVAAADAADAAYVAAAAAVASAYDKGEAIYTAAAQMIAAMCEIKE